MLSLGRYYEQSSNSATIFPWRVFTSCPNRETILLSVIPPSFCLSFAILTTIFIPATTYRFLHSLPPALATRYPKFSSSFLQSLSPVSLFSMDMMRPSKGSWCFRQGKERIQVLVVLRQDFRQSPQGERKVEGTAVGVGGAEIGRGRVVVTGRGMVVSGGVMGLDGVFFCVGIDTMGRIASCPLGTTTCITTSGVGGVSPCVVIFSFFLAECSSLRWTILSMATAGVSQDPSAAPVMPMLLALLLVSRRSCSLSGSFSFCCSGCRGEELSFSILIEGSSSRGGKLGVRCESAVGADSLGRSEGGGGGGARRTRVLRRDMPAGKGG